MISLPSNANHHNTPQLPNRNHRLQRTSRRVPQTRRRSHRCICRFRPLPFSLDQHASSGRRAWWYENSFEYVQSLVTQTSRLWQQTDWLGITLVSDITKSIARDYGVLVEENGFALRGTFIIDPNGVVRQLSVNDAPSKFGRAIKLTISIVSSILTFLLQF